MAGAPAPHGPPVPDEDTLYRVIVPAAAAVWFPGGVLSSAAFSHPVFSADIARLTTPDQTLSRWPAGSGIVAFNCGAARAIGFDARHEPEDGNGAHANVYGPPGTKERKRHARRLADLCTVVTTPQPAATPEPPADAPPAGP
jgi:hypothetical protein